MKYFIVLLCFITHAFANGIDFESHFFINGKEVKGMNHVMVKPNSPTLVEVYFTNPKNDEIYKDFKEMHGKYMHMVIASRDLSVFKHVHPYFDPTTGRFSLTLNMPYADPDNFDTHAALRKPGMYMVMADVIVHGVGMRMDHAMVHVMGQTNQITLNPDPTNRDESITKYFKRNSNETIPTYKTIFSYHTIQGCSGNIVNFEVEMFKHDGQEYREFIDFQPWLSEAAHSVWLSEGYMQSMMNMPFAHMHSPFILDDDDDETNDRVYDHILRFNFHDQKTMHKGLQKIWIQFKDAGKVMKIPFIFNYTPNDPVGC